MIGRGLFRQGEVSPQRFGTRVCIHRLLGLWRCCIHFRDRRCWFGSKHAITGILEAECQPLLLRRDSGGWQIELIRGCWVERRVPARQLQQPLPNLFGCVLPTFAPEQSPSVIDFGKAQSVSGGLVSAVDSGVLGFMGFMMIERIAKLIITSSPVARVS